MYLWLEILKRQKIQFQYHQNLLFDWSIYWKINYDLQNIEYVDERSSEPSDEDYQSKYHRKMFLILFSLFTLSLRIIHFNFSRKSFCLRVILINKTWFSLGLFDFIDSQQIFCKNSFPCHIKFRIKILKKMK